MGREKNLSRGIMSKAYQETLSKKLMAAGVLLFNQVGQFLIVKPTYKQGWEIPGGVSEANESLRQTVLREVQEEIGLTLEKVSLLCVDYNFADEERLESVQCVFDGGILEEGSIAQIHFLDKEITECRFVNQAEGLVLLRERVGQHVAQALAAKHQGKVVYLEERKFV